MYVMFAYSNIVNKYSIFTDTAQHKKNTLNINWFWMSCVQNDIVFLKKGLEDHLLNTHRLLLCIRWSNQFRPLKLDVSDFKMNSATTLRS